MQGGAHLAYVDARIARVAAALPDEATGARRVGTRFLARGGIGTHRV